MGKGNSCRTICSNVGLNYNGVVFVFGDFATKEMCLSQNVTMYYCDCKDASGNKTRFDGDKTLLIWYDGV